VGGRDLRGLALASRSTPLPEKFDPAAHALGTHARPDAQDTAQLFADRVALLRSQNHFGVFAAAIHPFCMDPIEIGDVERVHDASMFRGVSQMLVIGFFHQAGIRGPNHRHVARAKRGDEATVYSVFVDIDLKKLHRGSRRCCSASASYSRSSASRSASIAALLA